MVVSADLIQRRTESIIKDSLERRGVSGFISDAVRVFVDWDIRRRSFIIVYSIPHIFNITRQIRLSEDSMENDPTMANTFQEIRNMIITDLSFWIREPERFGSELLKRHDTRPAKKESPKAVKKVEQIRIIRP